MILNDIKKTSRFLRVFISSLLSLLGFLVIFSGSFFGALSIFAFLLVVDVIRDIVIKPVIFAAIAFKYLLLNYLFNNFPQNTYNLNYYYIFAITLFMVPSLFFVSKLLSNVVKKMISKFTTRKEDKRDTLIKLNDAIYLEILSSSANHLINIILLTIFYSVFSVIIHIKSYLLETILSAFILAVATNFVIYFYKWQYEQFDNLKNTKKNTESYKENFSKSLIGLTLGSLIITLLSFKLVDINFFVIFTALAWLYNKLLSLVEKSKAYVLKQLLLEDSVKKESMQIKDEKLEDKNIDNNINKLIIKLSNLNFKRDKSLSDLEVLSNELNSFWEDRYVSFQDKVDSLSFVTVSLANSGKKATPMAIIAFLIHQYQKMYITKKISPEIQNENSINHLQQRVKELLNIKLINTPTRMAEIIICWQYILWEYLKKHNRSLFITPIKRMPSFVKKELRKIFENYSVFTLKKHKLKRRSIKLKDLIKILHPKPKNMLMSAIYNGIIQDTKISKLKPNEYIPVAIKETSNCGIVIEKAPIKALLLNISQINLDNQDNYNKLYSRLENLVSNIDKTFIDPFQLFIPIFFLNQETISEISKKVKNFKIKTITNEIVDTSKITEVVIGKYLENTILTSLHYTTGITNPLILDDIHLIVKYLLKMEEILLTLSQNTTSIDFKNYSTIINDPKFKQREKLKNLLNSILENYFRRNQNSQKIKILLMSINNNYINNLSKILSFLVLSYPNYEIFVYNNKKITNYTKVYKEIVENCKPIDLYLQTFSFLVEIRKYSQLKKEQNKLKEEQNKLNQDFEDIVIERTLSILFNLTKSEIENPYNYVINEINNYGNFIIFDQIDNNQQFLTDNLRPISLILDSRRKFIVCNYSSEEGYLKKVDNATLISHIPDKILINKLNELITQEL